jgi:hypothetical protein
VDKLGAELGYLRHPRGFLCGKVFLGSSEVFRGINSVMARSPYLGTLTTLPALRFDKSFDVLQRAFQRVRS